MDKLSNKKSSCTSAITKMNVSKIFALLLIGFLGGCIGFWFLSWFSSVRLTKDVDAVSIANTYIVFTTIIFVGVTVILAVAGYAFTQQFSETKENQINELKSVLKHKIKCNENDIATEILDILLEDPDVKRHLRTKIETKVSEIIDSKISDTKEKMRSAEVESEAIQALSASIK